tara:strand:- start:46 stop:507 length:462 start_codon:yes stop_codon:yes gene_type:complete
MSEFNFDSISLKSDSNKSKTIAVIHSKFNSNIVLPLVEETKSSLNALGIDKINFYDVPGAFEIPFVVKKCIELKKFDGIICLGTIIRGETSHYELISNNVFSALMNINLTSNIPIINGVITTENEHQAKARIINAKYYAESCIQMIKFGTSSW